MVGSDHTLQAVDPTTRFRRWSIAFDTPPVGVFSASGGSNHLDPAMTPPPAASNATAVSPGDATRVLVGQIAGGGLYALPADHITLDETLTVRVLVWVRVCAQAQEQGSEARLAEGACWGRTHPWPPQFC